MGRPETFFEREGKQAGFCGEQEDKGKRRKSEGLSRIIQRLYKFLRNQDHKGCNHAGKHLKEEIFEKRLLLNAFSFQARLGGLLGASRG